MGSFIAKQPNGLYCRFSSVVDCPTDINMTREDYINLCMENARKEAINTLEKHLHDFKEVEERFVPNNMTRKQLNAYLRKMSLPQDQVKWEET